MKKHAALDIAKTPYEMLPMKSIIPPKYNMRDELDRTPLEQLQASISEIGLQQPIRVKKVGSKYEVIAGFRRYRASANLRLNHIPAFISTAVGLDAEIEKMHENLQREDINPLDEAAYYATIIKKYHISQKKLAHIINRTEGYISQRLDTLKYPANLAQAILNGTIALSAARELFAIKNNQLRDNYISTAIANGITPSLAAQWRQDANNLNAPPPDQPSRKPGDTSPASGPTPQLPCSCCGVPSEITQHTILRVDQKCYKKIQAHFQM